MAYFELNALSVVLGGSFTARVFLPEMDRLSLDDTAHEKRYPVLWLLHTDGETSLEFMKTPIERLCVKYGLIAIAPDMHHAMGTNMKYGPNMEKFLTREIRGIFSHLLPISKEKEQNFIGGVGTGAYGALKCVLKHPDLFSKAFSLNGILDMERIMEETASGREWIPHTMESLQAVFGEPSSFKNSENDLYSLLKTAESIPLFLSVEENNPFLEDTQKAASLAPNAKTLILPKDADLGSFQVSLAKAVEWLEV